MRKIQKRDMWCLSVQMAKCQSVWLLQFEYSKRANDSIYLGTSINTCWSAWAHSLSHFYWHSNLVSLANTLPLILIIFVRLGEHPSALLECLHLEALGDCVSLWDSLVTLGVCRLLNSLEEQGLSNGGWWLSPALIVVIVRGSALLEGAPKATLVDCSCHWATTLVDRFLRCLTWGRGSCNTS